LQRLFNTYRLHASQEEMIDYVFGHAQEVAGYIQKYREYESIPAFMADSTIDQRKFEAWLSQDTVFDRYSMRELEEQLRTGVIPQQQLQQIMKSQVHRTTAEEAFSLSMRENRAALKYYGVSADSFDVKPESLAETDLKAYFEAHPDSFHFKDDAVRLGYVRIPISPSKADTVLMFDFAKEIKARIRDGEKFLRAADLALKKGKPIASGKEFGKGAGRFGEKVGKGVKKAVSTESDRGDREKK